MTWHPILEAREIDPGHWQMFDGVQRLYGEIHREELDYRADRVWKDGTVETIGHYRELKTACWEVHRAFLRSHGAPPRTSYSS